MEALRGKSYFVRICFDRTTFEADQHQLYIHLHIQMTNTCGQACSSHVVECPWDMSEKMLQDRSENENNNPGDIVKYACILTLRNQEERWFA